MIQFHPKLSQGLDSEYLQQVKHTRLKLHPNPNKVFLSGILDSFRTT